MQITERINAMKIYQGRRFLSREGKLLLLLLLLLLL
jgi:hypothetical protein